MTVGTPRGHRGRLSGGVADSRFGRDLGTGERRQEAVALARYCLDEPRPTPIVLQLHPKVPNVAVNHVTLRDVIGSPQRIQDLIARYKLARVGRQQVEQTLLEPRQMELGGSGTHLAVEDVDLDLAESQHR